MRSVDLPRDPILAAGEPQPLARTDRHNHRHRNTASSAKCDVGHVTPGVRQIPAAPETPRRPTSYSLVASETHEGGASAARPEPLRPRPPRRRDPPPAEGDGRLVRGPR